MPNDILDANGLLIDGNPYLGKNEPPENQFQPETAKGLTIQELVASNNIAELISESELSKIADRCIVEYESDKQTLVEWEKELDEIFKYNKYLSDLKHIPWENASNVRIPIIINACIQFAARAYPAIVTGDKIAKAKVCGADPDGTRAASAERRGDYLSYQLLEKIPNWEESLDRLLVQLPFVGTVFRKTWYDPVTDLPVSEMVNAKDIVIDYFSPSLERAQRITHKYFLYKNEILEGIQSGMFLDATDKLTGGDDIEGAGVSNEYCPYLILEQHRWLDLDDDGYEESYIVTILKTSSTVLRIKARYEEPDVLVDQSGNLVKINPAHFFTLFTFMPRIDSNIYGLGLGHLLLSPAAVINTIINQMIDTATKANYGGGFYSGINVKGGSKIEVQMGEWIKVDSFKGDSLRDSLFEFSTHEPSQVLYTLLGLIIEYAEKISSSTDIMSGQSPGSNVPATTTLALVEQAMKVYTAVFKRIYRSLKEEFKKIDLINKKHINSALEELVYGNDQKVNPSDYAEEGMDIVPVADPKSVTDMQQMLKAETLMKLMGTGLNDDAIKQRYLESLHIPNVEELKGQGPPPPDPKIVLEQQKLELDNRRVTMEEHLNAMVLAKMQAEIVQLKANSIKLVADAEAQESGIQIEEYKRQIEEMSSLVTMMNEALPQETPQKAEGNEPNGQPEQMGELGAGIGGGMEPIPSNEGIPPEVAGGTGAEGEAIRGGGGVENEVGG